MTKLSVNINKIALLRNSRQGNTPCLNDFIDLALQNGASGITVHPRPDERHIRYQDVYQIKRYLDDFYPNAEFNVEGYPSEDFCKLMCKVSPTQVTLVPDVPEQLTSDHGWDVTAHTKLLAQTVGLLKPHVKRVSLFIDHSYQDFNLIKKIGADAIELYTQAYAQSYHRGDSQIIKQYLSCAQLARDVGLSVHAGHDLSLQNLKFFLSMIDIDEVSIGHALTVEALFHGYCHTIKRYFAICS